MKHLLLRTENIPLIEPLSYEQRGKLLTMLLTMASDGVTQEQADETNAIFREFTSSQAMLSIFLPFKSDFDADKKKYDNIVARNRTNGAKGGRPRKNKTQRVLKPTGIETQITQKTTIDGLSMINLNHNIIKKEKERNAPTLEDVLSAANRLMVTPEVATKFFYHYDADGWMINGRPIINWQSKLMEWKNNQTTFSNAANPNPNTIDFHAARKQQIFDDVTSAIYSSENGIADDIDYSIL